MPILAFLGYFLRLGAKAVAVELNRPGILSQRAKRHKKTRGSGPQDGQAFFDFSDSTLGRSTEYHRLPTRPI